METSRPPSYGKLDFLDGISRVVTLSDDSPTSSSSYTSDFDTLYDPSSDEYAENHRREQMNNKPKLGVLGLRRNQTVPAILARPLITEKRPPAIIPNQTSVPRNVIYSFIQSTTGNNSMTLVPAVDAEQNQARYSVTVSMNCFMPSSFITNVYHMNDIIGEFEMGMICNEIPSKVKFGGRNFNISDVLSKSGGRKTGSWFWNPFGVSKNFCLKWDYSPRPCLCYSTVGNKEILAKFTSPYGLNDTSGPSMLEVLPAGQEQSLFVHVLLSLLIIERKRLTPDRENGLKSLFN